MPDMSNRQDDKTKTEVQHYVCVKCDEKEMSDLVFLKEKILIFFSKKTKILLEQNQTFTDLPHVTSYTSLFSDYFCKSQPEKS